MKKLKIFVPILIWICVFVIFLFALSENAGTFKNGELDFAQIDTENPFRAKEYVESCATLTATVREFQLNPDCVWLEATDRNGEEIHITAWVNAKTAARLDIGEEYTFRGRIYYSPNYIRIGDPDPFMPFWFNAKVIEEE